MRENYFKENLKDLRRIRNVKQIELAQAIGATRSAISYYESGKSEPTLNIIVSISEFFNISVDELLKDHNNNFENEKEELKHVIFVAETMLENKYIDGLYELRDTYIEKLKRLKNIVDVEIPDRINEINKIIEYIEDKGKEDKV